MNVTCLSICNKEICILFDYLYMYGGIIEIHIFVLRNRLKVVVKFLSYIRKVTSWDLVGTHRLRVFVEYLQVNTSMGSQSRPLLLAFTSFLYSVSPSLSFSNSTLYILCYW
jgi:hypothetical protein